MSYAPERAFQHGTPARSGVLITNLGTPEAPTAAALRPYLAQFLGDPRVVEIPRPIWWLILHGVILRLRPAKSAQKYASIWTPDGSPLKVHTRRQAVLLKGLLGERMKNPPMVEWAMRYGQPSIADGMARLREAGCDRILVLPLYPQYAASTTASTFDAVAAALAPLRNLPAIRTVRHFHDHPGYIAALAASIRKRWAMDGEPDVLLMSFHGVPRYTLDKGDPYHCECHKTGRLLAEALKLPAQRWKLAFQSRFGKAEWLKPYTAATLEELGRAKVGRLDVVCPGFVSDCLETLEEIAMEGRHSFQQAGGGEFRYLPCLNDGQEWIAALADLIQSNLGGWLDEPPAAAELAASRERALALGAKA